MIILSKTLLSEIQAHGESTYPEECCGALLGKLDYQKNEKKALRILRIENESPEDRKTHFTIRPEDYKNIESYAKTEGLDLLGFYHSHPDHPPEPSVTDLEYAWPIFSYIIISVLKGVSGKIASYQLNLESNKFEAENLIFKDQSPEVS